VSCPLIASLREESGLRAKMPSPRQLAPQCSSFLRVSRNNFLGRCPSSNSSTLTTS
jgi:hypothetical protein